MTLGVLIALYDLFFGDFLEAVLGCQQVAACSSSRSRTFRAVEQVKADLLFGFCDWGPIRSREQTALLLRACRFGAFAFMLLRVAVGRR